MFSMNSQFNKETVLSDIENQFSEILILVSKTHSHVVRICLSKEEYLCYQTEGDVNTYILNRLSSKDFNFLIKYNFSDFKQEERGLSFFFRYNDKLIKAKISEENDEVEIAFFFNQLACQSLTTKCNLENLPEMFELLVKQTDFF